MTASRLLQRFSDRLNVQERAFRWADIHAIAAIVDAKDVITEQLREFGPPEPSDEIVMLAIQAFVAWSRGRRRETLSWLETALVCWGLLTPIAGLRETTILESKPLFAGLLRLLDAQGEAGKITPYLWRGLLNAYLSYRDDKNENWKALRHYLNKSLPVLAAETNIRPAWLDALNGIHRSILDKAPFDAYRKEVFSKHRPMVASLSEQLNIPETSWFWPGLLLQGIADLVVTNDNDFKSKIDVVLAHIKDHESCHDEGLSILLDRYARCATTEPHEGLKFRAVARWRSPILSTQRDWARVKPETKRMIQRWLVLEDLQDFFKILHADDGMNRRRYEFWMQFLDQMSYVHLVLGRRARESYPELLGKKLGRYSHLTGATSTNNAFIMRIGDCFFVEFGEVGKCWGYEENTARRLIPNTRHVGSISYHDLREAGQSLLVNRWGQRDGLAHQGDWEWYFLQSLKRIGIVADAMSLRELTERYQLQVSDRRKGSGAFWVRHKEVVGSVAEYLRNASFTYKNKSEGYYANARNVRWDS